MMLKRFSFMGTGFFVNELVRICLLNVELLIDGF